MKRSCIAKSEDNYFGSEEAKDNEEKQYSLMEKNATLFGDVSNDFQIDSDSDSDGDDDSSQEDEDENEDKNGDKNGEDTNNKFDDTGDDYKPKMIHRYPHELLIRSSLMARSMVISVALHKFGQYHVHLKISDKRLYNTIQLVPDFVEQHLPVDYCLWCVHDDTVTFVNESDPIIDFCLLLQKYDYEVNAYSCVGCAVDSEWLELVFDVDEGGIFFATAMKQISLGWYHHAGFA
jgi:hypothetical protein